MAEAATDVTLKKVCVFLPCETTVSILQAFSDLQTKMLSTRKQLAQCDAQVEYNTQVARKCEITRQELQTLPPETVAYQAVGRM